MKSSIDVESGRLLLFVCCVTVTGLSSALAVGHTHTQKNGYQETQVDIWCVFTGGVCGLGGVCFTR